MSLYLGNDLISGSKPINLGVRNIGEIFPASLPITDAGAHLLDGGLILGGGIYQGFVDYIADLYTANPDANYFTTEALWQQSVTTYGVCGKFVYDSVNKTVRLPKVTGIVEGTTDASALGDLIEAGLPNITGSFGVGKYEATAGSGCFVSARGSANAGAEIANYNAWVNTFNASRSNSIYGNSTTVQPQTIKAFYYIVIANSTKTDIQVDIDEIATDLNGKADVDLTNCTKPHIVETYTNGASWYKVYSDGWCEQGSNTWLAQEPQTITLLKPFNNTNYIITTSNGDPNTDSAVVGSAVNSKSISSFVITSGYQGVLYANNLGWRACGYIN